MFKRIRFILLAGLLVGISVAAVMLFTGCDDGSSATVKVSQPGTGTQEKTIYVKIIELNPPEWDGTNLIDIPWDFNEIPYENIVGVNSYAWIINNYYPDESSDIKEYKSFIVINYIYNTDKPNILTLWMFGQLSAIDLYYGNVKIFYVK